LTFFSRPISSLFPYIPHHVTARSVSYPPFPLPFCFTLFQSSFFPYEDELCPPQRNTRIEMDQNFLSLFFLPYSIPLLFVNPVSFEMRRNFLSLSKYSFSVLLPLASEDLLLLTLSYFVLLIFSPFFSFVPVRESHSPMCLFSFGCLNATSFSLLLGPLPPYRLFPAKDFENFLFPSFRHVIPLFLFCVFIAISLPTPPLFSPLVLLLVFTLDS